MERRSMVSDRVRVAEAVDTLHSMFGAWDIQVLEAVLESNRFDMDRAIDQLLTMEPPGGSGNATSTSRVILPDDFLRVPGYAEIKEQEKKDAMLAMMLQDELFRNELLASEEFSHVVTNEQGERQRSESTETDYMAVVGDKISSMSDTMKNKLSSLYTRFQNRNEQTYCQVPLMVEDDDDDEETEVLSNYDLHRRKAVPRRSRPSSHDTTSMYSNKKND